MKLTIIYIVGAGNSGSTLLSMVLGSHSRICSAGELSRLDEYLQADKTCTCGRALSECEFWGAVARDYRADPAIAAPLSPGSVEDRWRHVDIEAIRNAPSLADITRRNLALYERIARDAGASVIVDASKDLERLVCLHLSGVVKLVPVHLVRDGRAYIDSMQQRNEGRGNPMKLTMRWMRMNDRADRCLRKLSPGTEPLRVDYDAFTRDPASVLTEICARAGVGYEPQMLEYWRHEFHNIAGAKNRRERRPIEPQTEWKQRLPLASKLGFALAGGHSFNRRFAAAFD